MSSQITHSQLSKMHSLAHPQGVVGFFPPLRRGSHVKLDYAFKIIQNMLLSPPPGGIGWII